MDAAEFDAFYAGSFRRVVSQVAAMTGNRDGAQDCVQEAFARAWSHRRELSQANSPEAWVRTTAYRLAVSRWRREQLAKRSPDRALQAPRPQSVPDEGRVALMTALQRLPEDQRRALVLHHLCDLPVRDVAAEVGVPEGTVKARLSRGRAALLRLLAESPPAPPAPVAVHGG